MNVRFGIRVHSRWIAGGALLSWMALFLLCGGRPASAQSAGGVPTDAAGLPDLSGYWELRFDSRSVSPASLTPEATANLASQRSHDRLAVRWCANAGMPYIMGDSAPLDIRQGSKDIAIVAKTVSSVRYIFIDGRNHPDADILDPTTNGNSVGHWEGDTLVVGTVGFGDHGITSIPGGGYRTPNSHLVEHFRLLNGGKQLSVIFTWDDPKIFQKPHSYEFRYYRVAQSGYQLQYPCDARDAERAKFLAPDTQMAVAPR
jgi:hypothetical protein